MFHAVLSSGLQSFLIFTTPYVIDARLFSPLYTLGDRGSVGLCCAPSPSEEVADLDKMPLGSSSPGRLPCLRSPRRHIGPHGCGVGDPWELLG